MFVHGGSLYAALEALVFEKRHLSDDAFAQELLSLYGIQGELKDQDTCFAVLEHIAKEGAHYRDMLRCLSSSSRKVCLGLFVVMWQHPERYTDRLSPPVSGANESGYRIFCSCAGLRGLSRFRHGSLPLEIEVMLIEALGEGLSLPQKHPGKIGWFDVLQCVISTCGKLRLDAALPLLTEYVRRWAYEGGEGEWSTLREVTLAALRRYPPTEELLTFFEELAQEANRTARLPLLRMLLYWRQEPPCSLSELVVCLHHRETKSRRQATLLLWKRFVFSQQAHRAELWGIKQSLEEESSRIPWSARRYLNKLPFEGALQEEALLQKTPSNLFLIGASLSLAQKQRLFQHEEAFFLQEICPYLVWEEGTYAGGYLRFVKRGALRSLVGHSSRHQLLYSLVLQADDEQEANTYTRLFLSDRDLNKEVRDLIEAAPAFVPGEQPRGGTGDSNRKVLAVRRRLRRWGKLYSRLLLRDARDEAAKMVALRDLLSLPPSAASWAAICHFLWGWCRLDSFEPELVYPYVEEHIASWPDELRKDMLSPAQGKRCPTCETL